jgi:hypothetical protein
MADGVRETMDGTLGHFWTDLNDVFKFDRANDGYVRLVDDELFDVSTLRTLEFNREFGGNNRLPRPVAMYGMTASTRAIFFDIAGVSRSNVMGQQASTQTVLTRGVVVNVPFAVLENPNFKEVEIWIPEVTLWSGLQGATEHVQLYDDDRPRGYTASTVHVEPLEIQIRPGLKLTLGTTWSVEGPDDKRVLSTPLVVGTTSATPRTWQQHVVPLIAVQDLINLAYEGFVPAGHGTVQFQCKEDGQPRQTPQMWNSRLMTVSRGVSRPKSMTKFPLFKLDDIGSVRGVRNWIRLDHEYPRATGPLTNAYRYGPSGVELRLIEIALGLEYWTKVHKKLGRTWAQPRRLRRGLNEPLPMSIGRHVGPAFAEFVGDLAKWSDRFWETYNSLKHAPTFEYDAAEVRLLGDSGALLLLGALLNRVAGNRTPMKVLCDSHRTHMIGYNLRKLLR